MNDTEDVRITTKVVDGVQFISVAMEEKTKLQLAGMFLRAIGWAALALIVFGAWSGLAIFLWMDGQELFAGVIAALLLYALFELWRQWPRRRAPTT